MTQYLEAKSGNVTPEMIAVAQAEFLEPEYVRKEIAEGRLVIPATHHRRIWLLRAQFFAISFSHLPENDKF